MVDFRVVSKLCLQESTQFPLYIYLKWTCPDKLQVVQFISAKVITVVQKNRAGEKTHCFPSKTDFCAKNVCIFLSAHSVLMTFCSSTASLLCLWKCKIYLGLVRKIELSLIHAATMLYYLLALTASWQVPHWFSGPASVISVGSCFSAWILSLLFSPA